MLSEASEHKGFVEETKKVGLMRQESDLGIHSDGR